MISYDFIGIFMILLKLMNDIQFIYLKINLISSLTFIY